MQGSSPRFRLLARIATWLERIQASWLLFDFNFPVLPHLDCRIASVKDTLPAVPRGPARHVNQSDVALQEADTLVLDGRREMGLWNSVERFSTKIQSRLQRFHHALPYQCFLCNYWPLDEIWLELRSSTFCWRGTCEGNLFWKRNLGVFFPVSVLVVCCGLWSFFFFLWCDGWRLLWERHLTPTGDTIKKTSIFHTLGILILFKEIRPALPSLFAHLTNVCKNLLLYNLKQRNVIN